MRLPVAGDLASAILASSQRLGVDPVDLATAISYETAGTFDPWKAGPTTKWGQHRGLIQWGEPQRKEYGVYQGMPVQEQMRAAEKYLMKAGVRPGHGLLDIYSAINAGGVGLYNRSDAAAGGAPGTVRNKVEQQMGGHRQKAALLMGGGPTMAASAMAGRPTAPVAGSASMSEGRGPTSPIAAAFSQAPVAPPSLPEIIFSATQQNGAAQRQRAEADQVAQERRRALLDVAMMFA